MIKKIADLTLGELQDICSEHPSCLNCPIQHDLHLDDILCRSGKDVPENLNLNQPIEI